MKDHEYFDVPPCRVQTTTSLFPKNQEVTREKQNLEEEDNLVIRPQKHCNNQTRDRAKYNNKLIKQLKAAGINVDESSGLVVSSDQQTQDNFYSGVSNTEERSNSIMANNLVDLANETLDALTAKNEYVSEEEKVLSDWDPMKDSYEQKSFNSYKEPTYDADVTERHNPVRGTRISPAKGSEDEVTLYVSNIPITLNEDAIRNIFKQYGKVRRVNKCRPKVTNSDTTFGFVSYAHVREASEAIANLHDFDFGFEKKLRVRLAHGKKEDDGMHFVPHNIDIKLGGDYKPQTETINEDSGNDSLVESGNTPPKLSEPIKTNEDTLFKSMFPETTTDKASLHSTNQGFVPDGPRLYIQGISTRLDKDALQRIIGEIAPCKDAILTPPKTHNQYTTFGFITVGSVKDAETVIDHFNDFGNKIKVSYSNKSAKEYNKPISTSTDDDFYLNLLKEPSLESAFGEDVVKDPIIESPPAQTAYEPVTITKNKESPLGNIKGLSALANVLDASRSKPIKENFNTILARTPSPVSEPQYTPLKTAIQVADQPVCEPVSVAKNNESPLGNIKGLSALANVLDASRSPPIKENFGKDTILARTPSPISKPQYAPLRTLTQVVDQPFCEPVSVAKNNESPLGNIKGLSTLANVLDASSSNPTKENFGKDTILTSPVSKPQHNALKTATQEESPITEISSHQQTTPQYAPLDTKTLEKSPVTKIISPQQEIKASSSPVKPATVHYSGEEAEVSVESLMKILAPDILPAKTTDEEKITLETINSDTPNEESPPTPALPSETTFITSEIPSHIHPLETVSSRMEVQKLHSDSYDALITNVESPSIFYGVLVSKDGTIKTEMMSHDIGATFDRRKDLVFTFQAGCLCTVKIDNTWRRALILKIDERDIDVFLIDSGKKMTFKKEEIRPLLKEHKVVPAQALPMKLITAVPKDGNYWSEDATKFLQRILTNCKVRIRPEYKDKMVFGIRLKIGTQSIDKLLEDKGFAKQTMCELPQVAHDWKPIQWKEITGKMDIPFEMPDRSEFEIYVSHINSPNQFFCRLFEQSKDLKVDEVEQELKDLYENETQPEDLSIHPKMTCAFKLENSKWHRGWIKTIRDKVKVLAIDYGSNYILPTTSIYPLPEKFKELPAQSISMQLQYVIPIEGAQHFSQATIERFKLLTFGRVMIVRVRKVHNTIHRVLLFDKKTGCNVGDKLVEEGYASKIHIPKPGKPTGLPAGSPDKSQTPGGVAQNDGPSFGRGRVLGRGMALMKDRGLLKP